MAVTLEYEPGDNNYGADADGNRGIYVRGYWSGTAADACTLGHTLTPKEQSELQEQAGYEAGSVDWGDDEYDGPDYDAEDDL